MAKYHGCAATMWNHEKKNTHQRIFPRQNGFSIWVLSNIYSSSLIYLGYMLFFLSRIFVVHVKIQEYWNISYLSWWTSDRVECVLLSPCWESFFFSLGALTNWFRTEKVGGKDAKKNIKSHSSSNYHNNEHQANESRKNCCTHMIYYYQ